MVTISLCMIVKNEEKHLARCLGCVAKLVEEIIIVDTGSTDQTVEIASRYTPNVYSHPWTDDFSDARNYSFSKATMDYCMWMDADDIIVKKCLRHINPLAPTHGGIRASLLLLFRA